MVGHLLFDTLGTATPITQIEEPLPFNPSHIREFTPQNYDTTSMNGASLDQQTPYDPFTMPSAPSNVQTAQFNPYLDDNSTLAGSSTGYYPAQTPYPTAAQPLQYHLYAPIGPHKEDLLAYQRTAHDFFMPEKIREELQRKSEATLQVMPNSQLPTLDHYHSLVPLDTTHHKNVAVFGYPSWVYKAQSSKNGRFYCLRRIEGYRLSNEKAIRTVKDWKRVNCGGVVSVIDAFTTRVFGDASIIFVYDYHPLSKTLVETHFTNTNRYGGRATSTIAEQVIWGYIVQIATAIKNVHNANLAVRCMEPSKIILTAKSRIRFSACSILDVVRYEAQKPMSELQQEDFIHFGKLVLSLASNSLAPQQGAIDQLSRLYTPELRDTVIWLLTPTPATQPKSIDDFLRGIATHVVASFDSSLHAEDTLASELYRELENGRLARLLMKLGTINDRPEYDDRTMAETSDRVQLAMFRDYVFHQVDANGNPVIDLGHIISCLNKLDAGVDEKILLTSRNEQNVYVVSYKELKRWVGAAFGELTKASRQGGRGI
ncbi:MAG: PAB-dependent poly(A)-specific ribonuclease subunit 3 [Claussenomyces sp. TS43310]|nr:MAG: PAB-dependent poly(A)-specific ribonuclease subunit 3 [Claussenomyces sp. TS43310]